MGPYDSISAHRVEYDKMSQKMSFPSFPKHGISVGISMGNMEIDGIPMGTLWNRWGLGHGNLTGAANLPHLSLRTT